MIAWRSATVVVDGNPWTCSFGARYQRTSGTFPPKTIGAPTTPAATATTTAQPVVAQTTTQQTASADVGVVQQWTDMNGYTWRTMEDGSTLWWTGSSWEKYA